MAGSVKEPVANAVSLSARTIAHQSIVAYNHNDLEGRKYSSAFQYVFFFAGME